MPRTAFVYGAGASLGAPAGRPLFAQVRRALGARLDVDLDDRWTDHMAPEALLSRLDDAGIDIDGELRGMLAGGQPNALHAIAACVLRRGGSVWTTNFDELIEAEAKTESVNVHVLLPGDDPACACGAGHLVKIHGTLSAEHIIARSEEVLRPLPSAWLDRLRSDLRDARVWIVGYAGADIDLRTGLAEALAQAATATWFCQPAGEAELRQRFGALIDTGALVLDVDARPDLRALARARQAGLDEFVTAELAAQIGEPIVMPTVEATFEPDDLVRARVLDDFGRARDARRAYHRATWLGPRRRQAGVALASSGLIYGALWRRPAVAMLDAACALPTSWPWPHRQRLPYLTFNVEAAPRLRALEQSLRVIGNDPRPGPRSSQCRQGSRPSTRHRARAHRPGSCARPRPAGPAGLGNIHPLTCAALVRRHRGGA